VCPDDYEKSVAMTPDMLGFSSLKMNAPYSARSGRDYCCVGSKGTEKENKRNFGASCIT
jgi:hypothetical protein